MGIGFWLLGPISMVWLTGGGVSVSAWFMDQQGSLTVEADKAIECSQEGRLFKATGGVCVRKGQAVIKGDTLICRRCAPWSASASAKHASASGNAMATHGTKASSSVSASASVLGPGRVSSSAPASATAPVAIWKDITVQGHVRIQHPNGTIACDQAVYDVTRNQWTARGKRILITHVDWDVVCDDGIVHCHMDSRVLQGTGSVTWTHRHTRQQVHSRRVALVCLSPASSPYGALGLGPVHRIHCSESVTFWSPKFHGKAGSATYHLSSRLIDLHQGVVLVFGSNIVQSRTAQWNIATKTLHVPPSSGESVRALIVPVAGFKPSTAKTSHAMAHESKTDQSKTLQVPTSPAKALSDKAPSARYPVAQSTGLSVHPPQSPSPLCRRSP